MKRIMINNKTVTTIAFMVLIAVLISCHSKNERYASDVNGVLLKDKAFVETLNKHLQAVSNRDTTALMTTLSPEGKMMFILPELEMASSVDEFMQFHKAWFQDTTWTFEAKILSTEIGDRMGVAATEVIYKEPERNGQPYFNRMIVSYALREIEGQWYVIMDHASSVEKTIDSLSQQ